MRDWAGGQLLGWVHASCRRLRALTSGTVCTPSHPCQSALACCTQEIEDWYKEHAVKLWGSDAPSLAEVSQLCTSPTPEAMHVVMA